MYFILCLEVKMYLRILPLITEGTRYFRCLAWQMLFKKCCVAGVRSLAVELGIQKTEVSEVSGGS